MIFNRNLLFLWLLTVPFSFLGAQNEDQALRPQINVETGFLGAWFTYEHPIADEWSIRLEAGSNFSLFGGLVWDEGLGFAMVSNINLETRYYLDRRLRIERNKSFRNNGGNFFSMTIHTNPNIFDISNYSNAESKRYVRIFPSFGLKRPIGKSFFFEFGFGAGYSYWLNPEVGKNPNNITADLRLRFGYVLWGKK